MTISEVVKTKVKNNFSAKRQCTISANTTLFEMSAQRKCAALRCIELYI